MVKACSRRAEAPGPSQCHPVHSDANVINSNDATAYNSDAVRLRQDRTVHFAQGELIGIEILKASSYIRDAVLDTAQAKLLEKSLRLKSRHT